MKWTVLLTYTRKQYLHTINTVLVLPGTLEHRTLTKTPSHEVVLKSAVELVASPRACWVTLVGGWPKLTVSSATRPDTWPKL